MLIPIFKPGDVLVGKTPDCDEKVLVFDSKIKSETEEYTTDMDVGCGITRHEIKTSEWVEYGVISKGFNFIRIAEDALYRWYRRVNHVDLPYNFVEADSSEKDEEIRKAREAVEFYKDQLRDCRKDFCNLRDDNVKLTVENEKLAIRIKELRTCINEKTEEAESRSLFWKRAYDERGKVINDLNEKLQKATIKVTKEDLKQCEEVSEAWDKTIHDNVSLRMMVRDQCKEIKDLNDQLKMAYGCIDRFTIDAVAGMRRAGCSVEKIAKTLNMPEQAVRIYLNAADVLDCKEEE